MIKTEEELIWENYIILESFKDYIKKYGSTQLAKDAVDLFKKERHRIPSPQNDIGAWMQKPPALLWQFLHNELPDSKRQIVKKQKLFDIDDIKNDDNVELIHSDDKWIVMGVKNFEGSSKWASQTTDWCVTKTQGHYNQYTDDGIFVFVFNLEKEPYNIHTRRGEHDSKLAYRFDDNGDILDIHDAPDNETSRAEGDQIFFNDASTWAEENIGEAFSAKIDEASERADELNKELNYGSIMVDGYSKDDYYVNGHISFDFSDYDLREFDYRVGSGIIDRIDHGLIGYGEGNWDSDRLLVDIRAEVYNHYGNIVIAEVEDIGSTLEDIESNYFNVYYNILQVIKEKDLIRNSKNILVLDLFENENYYADGDIEIDNNMINIHIIHGYDYKYTEKEDFVSIVNNTVNEYVYKLYTHYKEIEEDKAKQMDLDLRYESTTLDDGNIDIDNIIVYRKILYNGHGFSVNVKKINDIQSDLSNVDYVAIFKLLTEDYQFLKEDLDNIYKKSKEEYDNKVKKESRVAFKKVFYS
jgi:hypothetical protein